MFKKPIPTMRDINTLHTIGLRSIPKSQRSQYLELYNLKNTMDRLEKEKGVVDQRNNGILKKISFVQERMEKLYKEIRKESKEMLARLQNEDRGAPGKAGRPIPAKVSSQKPHKTMVMHY